MRCVRTGLLPTAFTSLFLAGLLVVGFGKPSSANFYSLQEWSALGSVERQAYMAGAFDSMITVGSGEEAEKVALHYRGCVRDARMSLGQLAENVLRFAKSKPELQAGPVQTALVRYLITACGEPLSRQ